MDVRNYQKMFPSSQQQQQFYHQQQQNSIPSMNFCYPPPPSFHRQHHQQQQYYHNPQQSSLMNSTFNNPFSTMSKPSTMNFGHQNYNNRFMSSYFQQQQLQQQQQRNMNNFQLPPPPTFNLPSTLPSTSTSFNPASMTNSPPSLTLSTDGSTKEETAREIFFRTLSASLKEANKYYSGKTTTWKNPFLYKTHLCENYCNKSYCRFGVNCWYAHGPHELRCIPESDELPDPEFISQYLSFLGLPKQTLDQIIQYAFYVANLLTSTSESSIKSSTLPSIDSTPSASFSPIKNDKHVQLSTSADTVAASEQMNTPKPSNDNTFLSSLASNGGWGEIESAINGTLVNDENSENNANFGKSFHLFGNSFNPQ